VLWSRERSSRALWLSGADGVPEYGLEEGEVGRYGEGEVCEQCKEAPMARRDLAEMQGRRRMGSMVPSVC
jgi:hypothetical protein